MSTHPLPKNHEYPYTGYLTGGFQMLGVALLLIPAIIIAAYMWISPDYATVITLILVVAEVFLLKGFFVQQPNQARVMIFFGNYRGTCRETGFYWVNPLMSRKSISLRIRNMDIEPIKVNDRIGNPVLIGMVLVWKVNDTYRAVFDVDSAPAELSISGNSLQIGNSSALNSKALENFVRIQSDAALREVTGQYAYDDDDHSGEITLRSGGDEINELLERKINERLAMAGIEVVEARLNYLAYAPEIAAVMLRRQQASAIISAREKIVEGAVSMVKMALEQLRDEHVVELDEERKAAMVSNLLVVLCADDAAQPVVNTGSLYQ